MLYGVNDQLQPQPQMVEGHEVSSDFKTWTFKLRPGLKFHDGEPVLAKDAVASINRWMVRDAPMGGPIKKRLDALEVVDDRTFRFRLNQPYPKMLFALGKSSTPALFIMPERIAATDPFKQISEYVGSGPMRFKKDEWVPGAKAVFEQFDGYVPRAEKANWLAGGKRMNFDRIEWQIVPDAATAAAALQNGEVDWWETPITDLIPLLKKNPNVAVDIADPLGNIGSFRINHLYPPFNDVRARRAVQIALSQEDYMGAVVGDDETLWKKLPSFFTPDTPLYTENGGEPLKGKRDYELAKKLLAEAGYKNEPIMLLVATDVPITKAQGDVTADLLKQIGMNVQYQALDWGTVGQRRASKEPAGQGRLEHLPYLACRCRLREPGALYRAGLQRRHRLVRLAEIRPGAGEDRRLVRRARPGGREEGDRRAEQGGDGLRRLHPDRVLQGISGLADEHLRHRQGAVPGVLGRDQGVNEAGKGGALPCTRKGTKVPLIPIHCGIWGKRGQPGRRKSAVGPSYCQIP